VGASALKALRPALTPAEARVVAEILSWPDGPWDYLGCASVGEWRELVATIACMGVMWRRSR